MTTANLSPVAPPRIEEQQSTLLRMVAEHMLEGPMRLLHQQEALLSIIKSPVFQGDDINAAFQLLTGTAAQLMNVSRVSVWRYNAARDAIVCLDLHELSTRQHSCGLQLQASQFPRYFEALATSETICADDAQTDLRTSEFTESYLAPLNIRSMMDIPLILRGRLEGVICHEQVGTLKTWAPADRLFGMAISNLTALAMERIENHQIAARLQNEEEQRRRIVEQRLQQSEERYRSLVNNLKIAVFQTDAQGNLTFLNPAWSDLSGYPTAACLTNRLVDYVHDDDRDTCRRQLQSLYDGKPDCRTELRIVTAAGAIHWVEGYARSITGSAGTVAGCSGTFTDITQRKAADAHIKRLAYQDALTGLPNRTLLLDRLDHAIAEAKRNHRRVAILYLDLDKFKGINDTLGHGMGDAVLSAIGGRVKGLLREEDTIGRLGGDEFLVVLAHYETRDDARSVSIKAIQALSQPVAVGEHDLQVSVSVGISVYPDDASDRDTLLRNADIALYRAKSAGHGTYQFFSDNAG